MQILRDKALKEALRDIVDMAYPDNWETAWLALPLDDTEVDSLYNFHVICSDLAYIKNGKSKWPPSSRDPKVWLQWELPDGTDFWIRPKKFDPLLRDRLILLEQIGIDESSRRQAISSKSLRNACYFAALSGRMVWYNPPKGGANSPTSAHFQSMPLHWVDHATPRFCFPCCSYQPQTESWTLKAGLNINFMKRGLRKNQYPVLGLAVSGALELAADFVWKVIWQYDQSKACNLVIQPASTEAYEKIIRIFVFPRSRDIPTYSVTDDLLKGDEKILMRNNREGVWSIWSFAGVEMGLLTQVEWGPVFEEMTSKPMMWGKTLLSLLHKLSLSESQEDWIQFVRIVNRLTAALT